MYHVHIRRGVPTVWYIIVRKYLQNKKEPEEPPKSTEEPPKEKISVVALHMAPKTKNMFNAFDIGSMLDNVYSLSFAVPTIREGFLKCRLWKPDIEGTNLSAVERLFENKLTKGSVQLSDLLKAFTALHRSQLRDASVVEEGRIAIDTKSGVHITSEAVIGALRKRELQRRKQLSKAQQLSDEAAAERRAYKEPAADIRRLVELSEERAYRRKHLRQSRDYRRLR